ncbi:hypothetical protein D3C71_2109690 [compost metagenome]
MVWKNTFTAEENRLTGDLLREGRITTERPRWPDWQLPRQNAQGNSPPFTGRRQATD